MKRLSFSIILGLLLWIAPSVHAQVTIGSGTEPNPGALLDLKQDGSTTKGLGMPRVQLTSKTDLFPMFVSGAANYSGGYKTTEDTKHTGLMVYNVDQCTLQGKGLYVWDGTQWTILGSLALGAGVIEHPAKAGVYEAFTSADFGTAGHWMTTNLTAEGYDTRTAGKPWATIAPALKNIGTYTDSYTAGYWGYPNIDGTKNAALDKTYTANPRLGLLYNWFAATGGQNTSDDDQEELDYPHIQGICPMGWHLPSNQEWILLLKEIRDNGSKYSSLTDAKSKENSMLAMLACEENGASNLVSKGGFSVLLPGEADREETSGLEMNSAFWSSSNQSQGTNAWLLAFNTIFEGMPYTAFVEPVVFASVRCKKD